VVVALAAYGVYFAGSTGYILPIGPPGQNWIDPDLYSIEAHRVRAGESYYVVASEELRAAGYPMRSMFNYRLPTLAWVFGLLPSDEAARGLLVGIAALAFLAWAAALRTRASPGAAVFLLAVLAGLLAWSGLTRAFYVHEVWAGILIALAIGAAAAGWGPLGVAAGLAALAVRELALPYVAVALAMSVCQRRRGEAAAWAAGSVAFAAGLAAHAAATARFSSVADGAHVGTWLQFGGWPFVLKTAFTNAWLVAAPQPVTAVLLPLALIGLGGWRGALGLRVSATVFLYVAAFLVAGQKFNYMWGYLYCGLAPMGLAFAPAAVGDLWRAATARRATAPRGAAAPAES